MSSVTALMDRYQELRFLPRDMLHRTAEALGFPIDDDSELILNVVSLEELRWFILGAEAEDARMALAAMDAGQEEPEVEKFTGSVTFEQGANETITNFWFRVLNSANAFGLDGDELAGIILDNNLTSGLSKVVLEFNKK